MLHALSKYDIFVMGNKRRHNAIVKSDPQTTNTWRRYNFIEPALAPYILFPYFYFFDEEKLCQKSLRVGWANRANNSRLSCVLSLHTWISTVCVQWHWKIHNAHTQLKVSLGPYSLLWSLTTQHNIWAWICCPSAMHWSLNVPFLAWECDLPGQSQVRFVCNRHDLRVGIDTLFQYFWSKSLPDYYILTLSQPGTKELK